MENFNKKKINPIDFIEKYNKQYNKSFILNNDLKNKNAGTYIAIIIWIDRSSNIIRIR